MLEMLLSVFTFCNLCIYIHSCFAISNSQPFLIPLHLAHPQILQENTEISYDWSFVLGWLGVFTSLAASFLFFFSSCCLCSEKEKEQLNNVQYIMPGSLSLRAFLCP